MIAGYDPLRIARLGLRTDGALGSLDGIASDDVAATGAIVAVRRLRSVLATRFAPAVAAIRATDPLAACPPRYDQWLRSQTADIDLVVMLHIELTQLTETHGTPDADDPFWSDEFAGWVEEFERRTQRDPGFAALLADEAGTDPLIGYIVAAGDFADSVLLAVTEALLNSDPNGPVHDAYRDGAITAALAAIAERPSLASTLLGASHMVERLLTWNDDAGGAFGIDGGAVGAVFESALRGPSEEAHAILARLVALAHGPRFDRGFPPGTAAGITTGLLRHVPSLLDSLDLDGDVYVTDGRGRFGAHLGSSAAVVDLFGALTRDGSARALLLAAIPVLAVYDPDAVNNYVKALVEAAETEQIEEEIRASRTRAEWNAAIDVVSRILGVAFQVGGKKLAVAEAVAHVVEAGARWLVDRIDADDLGMEDVHATAFLLLTFGASVAFLRRRSAVDDEAEERVAEIERLLGDGATREEVEREVLNLRSRIEELGGEDALPALDDPRIALPTYEASTDGDLAD